MKEYIKLGNRISAQNEDLVKDILSSNNNLDVLHGKGTFFIRSIENNNIKIVEALLEYFEKNQLSKYDSRSIEYYNLKTQLIEIIDIAIDEVNLSSEMKEILSPYIDFEGSEHDTLNDSFSDIDQTTFIKNFNKDAVSKNLLNEEILRKFDIETKPNNQIKTMENLLDFGDSGTHYQVEEHDTANIVLSGNLAHEVH